MYVEIIFAKTFCVEIIFFDKHIENITSAGHGTSLLVQTTVFFS